MALRYVLVRKRGARQDGRNYVATCTVCPGAKRDVSGVLGVSKETAQSMATQHCDTYHDGKRTF